MGLLSLAIWTPIAFGVVLLALGRDDQAPMVRWIALLGAAVGLVVTVPLYTGFKLGTAALQFVEKAPWIENFNIHYHLGVDGISLWLVLLTAFINVVVIVASWESITTRVNQYMGAFLILSGLMIGVFSAQDAMLFYVFFEATLIPMYLIIGIWGGPNKIYAAFKFFLYTLLGSLLMLIALIYLYVTSGGSFDILTWHQLPLPLDVQSLLFFAFLAAFSVKVPMWPVHTWLPDAHVEAPTAGSVFLAGILLKMGGYGFLRFSLPMFPNASDLFAPLIFAMSAIAVIYTSLVAFRQTDVKKLIAYSSVAHMGLVTMGIFSGNVQGEQGAIYQMLSHGVISGALFLCVGVIYDRMHTREIKFYGGLVTRMPVYAAVFMLFTMGNVGLPGTSGFVGEILTMVGVYKVSTWTAIAAASGVILSAVYMLTLYRAVVFGTIQNPKLESITDLNWREVTIFVPLIAATLYMGVQPNSVFDLTAASVDQLVRVYQAAIGGAPS
eukprot:gene15479-32716_t